MTPVLAVIPARFGSTRFPGKPLAARTGKPLIQHVVEQTQRARRISRVVVATDDTRIFNAVRAFGGDAVMTRADHPNGTSRIAEAVDKLDAQEGPAATSNRERSGAGAQSIIVNVQGDEPEIEPQVIDELVAGLEADPDAPMGP